MRRFMIVAPDCATEDKNAWEDVGFKLVETGAELEPGQRPDVLFWRWPREHVAPKWQSVKHLLPKLFITVSNHKISMPDTLSDIYEQQLITVEGTYFTIGSRIQGIVAVPVWEAYRGSGQLHRAEQVQAIAGSIYRYLLQDVFRETAEWCGHMSSVVGPA